jgi:hypothetical protein
MAGHRADMMKLVKLAKKRGCEVERSGSGHWKITAPNGTVVTASFSPNTPGAYRDTIKALRKAGLSL